MGVPSELAEIAPYASMVHGNIFEDSVCPVNVIKAERTFWEKATILHQQVHRQNSMPLNYSRHYYDLYQMADSDVGTSALADLQLLTDVVEFKQRFYRCPWAKYELAVPGTFRLIPPDNLLQELESDYESMQEMIFNSAPDWHDIIDTLGDLENEINSFVKI